MPQKFGSYAKGIHSWGVCDYCGQVWRYLELRKQLYQITNLQQKPVLINMMVCPEDFDPDVQIKVLKSDPQALRNPRVDNKDLPPEPPTGSEYPDSQGYVWDSVMTNTYQGSQNPPWVAGPLGMYPQWITRTVRNFSVNGFIVTATVQQHDLTAGNSILIENAADAAYNGLWTVAAIVSGDQFTYVINTEPTLISTGGQVTRLIVTEDDY